MTQNQIEEKEEKPPKNFRLFKEDFCFSGEISKIEHIPKETNGTASKAVDYHECSDAIVCEGNTQN